MSKYGTEELNFIEFGQVLTDIGLFKEIFAREQEEKKIYAKRNGNRNFRAVKAALVKAKQHEKRRREEIDFYEQSWMLLNPRNIEIIPVEMCVELMKILFCPVVNDHFKIVKEVNETLGDKIQSSTEESRTSPVTDKPTKLWSVHKLVIAFSELKENSLAYRQIGNINSKVKNDTEEMQVTT